MTKARAEQRAATLGRQRARALAAAEQNMADIAEFAPAAIAAGVPKRTLATLCGISRPTLDAILATDRVTRHL